jgi:hypothetical protein
VIVKQESLNTILAATGLAVSIVTMLITVIGALAAVVVGAFVAGIVVGTLIHPLCP